MNVHLYADSQGRSAYKDHKPSSMVKPGARFKDVVSESYMAGFSDVIVVLASTNDVARYKTMHFFLS